MLYFLWSSILFCVFFSFSILPEQIICKSCTRTCCSCLFFLVIPAKSCVSLTTTRFVEAVTNHRATLLYSPALESRRSVVNVTHLSVNSSHRYSRNLEWIYLLHCCFTGVTFLLSLFFSPHPTWLLWGYSLRVVVGWECSLQSLKYLEFLSSFYCSLLSFFFFKTGFTETHFLYCLL